MFSLIRSSTKNLLHQYVYQNWNIGIAFKKEDFTLFDIKWLKHNYKDRWFADPFILGEDEKNYFILAEECMYETEKGRIVKLTVDKNSFSLVENETILDLPSHLSFPNFIKVDDKVYLYPENASSGTTSYYILGSDINRVANILPLGVADPVIFKHENYFYLLATVGEQCNGNVLTIFRSSSPLSDYQKFHEFVFKDNVARRAGNVFVHEGRLISPAQICNNDYGEGISLQEITLDDDNLNFTEIKRMYPPTKDYPEGFHTYNVWKDKVIIDGYRYGSKFLHNLYFKIRKSR